MRHDEVPVILIQQDGRCTAFVNDLISDISQIVTLLDDAFSYRLWHYIEVANSVSYKRMFRSLVQSSDRNTYLSGFVRVHLITGHSLYGERIFWVGRSQALGNGSFHQRDGKPFVE
ncbi:hypothetical protein EVAR_23949_1 [Eumeta japonica]|uniref:Uncharacterized protein n=1 Tax=Eumeta variegata TaxID=151549 RepID=A0A4C1V171_EUMVA|nr:hypothetical protein EVAR_23922_1 [Eumeta japonica]GBP32538.1 hypothetical protein EVAR_23949_1 [Eumeta japonica]